MLLNYLTYVHSTNENPFMVVVYFKLLDFVTYEYGLSADQEHQLATMSMDCLLAKSIS